MGLPTLVCAKVVEREIYMNISNIAYPGQKVSKILTDSMTAPVVGSWGLPAWTARVPKLCTGEGTFGGVRIDRLVMEGDIMVTGLVPPVAVPRKEEFFITIRE